MNQISKLAVFLCATAFSNYSLAQGSTHWRVQGPSLVLPFQSSQTGKYAIVAVAYEKSFFRCKPSIALVTYEGDRLGSLTDSSTFRSSKNKLKIIVNGEAYLGDGDTKLNTYSNGIEIISFFDSDAISALERPSNIAFSIGNNPSVFSGDSTNSISVGLKSIIASCENN